MKDFYLLEDNEIIAFIESCISWDYIGIESAVKELCRRYDVDFTAFNDYETLYDAIMEEMGNV